MELGFSEAAEDEEKEMPAVRIGEVAERTGARVRSLRHYERAGLITARRDGNGYRIFDPGVVGCVRRVRGLLDANFTMSEILPLSASLVRGKSSEPCPGVVVEL